MNDEIMKAVFNGFHISLTPVKGPTGRVEKVRIGTQAETWNGVVNLNRTFKRDDLDAMLYAEEWLSRVILDMVEATNNPMKPPRTDLGEIVYRAQPEPELPQLPPAIRKADLPPVQQEQTARRSCPISGGHCRGPWCSWWGKNPAGCTHPTGKL